MLILYIIYIPLKKNRILLKYVALVFVVKKFQFQFLQQEEENLKRNHPRTNLLITEEEDHAVLRNFGLKNKCVHPVGILRNRWGCFHPTGFHRT